MAHGMRWGAVMLALMVVAAGCGGGGKKASTSCAGDGECGAGVCFDSACFATCEAQGDCQGGYVCATKVSGSGRVADVCVVEAVFSQCTGDDACKAMVPGECQAPECDPGTHKCELVTAQDGTQCGAADGVQGACRAGKCEAQVVEKEPEAGEVAEPMAEVGEPEPETMTETVTETEAETGTETEAEAETAAETEVECVPDCGRFECGDDGCGGTCGECTPPESGGTVECVAHECVIHCEPGSGVCSDCWPLDCVPCGGPDGPCCEGGDCDGLLVCLDGTCACGDYEQPCCDGACDPGLACNAQQYCACGHQGEPCCGGLDCDWGLACAGEACSCAIGCDGYQFLTAQGTIWDGTPGDPQPVLYPNADLFGDAGAFAYGGYQGCAVAWADEVWCWEAYQLSDNTKGSLGCGTTAVRDPYGERVVVKVVTGDGQPLTSVVSLDRYGNHACAVRGTGEVWCWGDNDGGLLFQGEDRANTYSSFAVPVQDAGGGSFTGALEVAVGYRHVCARKQDDSLWCWGSNAFGELGTGDKTPQPFPTLVGQAGNLVKRVVAGLYATCALIGETGEIWCWGDDSYGISGDGTDGDEALMPKPVIDGNGDAVGSFVDLALGGNQHVWARMGDDSLWYWGSYGGGPLHPAPYSDDQGPLTGVRRVGAWSLYEDEFQPCLVTTGGLALVGSPNGGAALEGYDPKCRWCEPECRGKQCGDDGCGGESCGTCAAGSQCVGYRCLPDPCTPDCTAKGCGDDGCGGQCPWLCDAGYHCVSGTCVFPTCGATCEEGQVLVAGGRVLQGLTPEFAVQHEGATGTEVVFGVTQVAAGSDHACAIGADREVLCWRTGLYPNDKGQLGDGTTTPPLVFNYAGQVLKAVGVPLSGAVALDAFDRTTCAVLDDTSLWCWGESEDGALFGSSANSFEVYATQVMDLDAAPVAPFTGVVEVAVGGRHACARATDDTVWCWGDDAFGALGFEKQSYQDRWIVTPRPVSFPNGEAIVQLSAGVDSTCGLTGFGTVYCWGHNDGADLGNGLAYGVAWYPNSVRNGLGGTDFDRVERVVVADFEGQAGQTRVYALREDGSVWYWGLRDGGPAVPKPYLLDGQPLEQVWSLGSTAGWPCFVKWDGSTFGSSGLWDAEQLVPYATGCGL
jgi:alpha-tubulin suppressor-like RCC1 family protein